MNERKSAERDYKERYRKHGCKKEKWKEGVRKIGRKD